ncbi:MAG TPA: hypothetical protein VFY69_05305 [Solirubrobacterales bacterium]|nr:hypothetical protein [Solirubrobacterales bacterium]
MMPLRAYPALVALAGVALVSSGCWESTQEKSAAIAAELGPVRQEKGLKISKRSKDVNVVSTTLLTDANGSAVVVEVRNQSDRDLVDVPILIDVLDAKGKSVYSNDLPGLEPALTSTPYVEAGEETTWVHDQVLAAGKPERVEVTVGAGGTPYGGEIPEFTATDPKLDGDPHSGVVAGGKVENESGGRNERLLLYAVARRGEEIVAAGRGAIERIKPEPKPLPYNIYFIGDPTGADVEVTWFPTLPGVER